MLDTRNQKSSFSGSNPKSEMTVTKKLLLLVVLLLAGIRAYGQPVEIARANRCYGSGSTYTWSIKDEDFALKKSPKLTHPFAQNLVSHELSLEVSEFQLHQEYYSSILDQASPSIVVFKEGNFLIVWQDESFGDRDIYAQKFDSSGTALGINFRILGEIDLSDRLHPDVARLGDSSFILVWVEEEEQNIYAQKFDPDFSPNSVPIQVNEAPISNPYLRPVMATFPDGGFVVTWQDTRTGIDIYARRFNSSGYPLSPSFKVNGGNSFLPESPSVATDTSGVFVIVWTDFRDGDRDIYFQRYSSGGSSLDTNLIANTDVATEIQDQPRVAFGKSKDFMITWVDFRNGNEDIFVRLFSWDGMPRISDRKVNSDLGSDGQWFPDIGADSNGHFIVAWADYRGELPAVYAQKFDTNGTRSGPNILISDSLATGEKQMTSIWVKEPGDYVVSWWNARDLNFDIYAQMVNPVGILKGQNIKANDDLLPGDANGNGEISITDVVYALNYLYNKGPAPDPLQICDVNCDGSIGITDVVRVINYLYNDGPPPC